MANIYNVKKIRKYYCTFGLESGKSLKYSIIYATNINEAEIIACKQYGGGGFSGIHTEHYEPKIKLFRMEFLEEIPHERYGKGAPSYNKRRWN